MNTAEKYEKPIKHVTQCVYEADPSLREWYGDTGVRKGKYEMETRTLTNHFRYMTLSLSTVEWDEPTIQAYEQYWNKAVQLLASHSGLSAFTIQSEGEQADDDRG